MENDKCNMGCNGSHRYEYNIGLSVVDHGTNNISVHCTLEEAEQAVQALLKGSDQDIFNAQYEFDGEFDKIQNLFIDRWDKEKETYTGWGNNSYRFTYKKKEWSRV